MPNLAQQPDSLASMFDLCRQVIPYLEGKLEDEETLLSMTIKNDQWIKGNHYDQATIHALQNDLKHHIPDAGDAYYRARTWHLLCWQPIYIAFISIYGLQKSPDFSSFKQQRQHNSIIGFVFQNNKMLTGNTEQLIKQAGTQLATLIENYRKQLDHVERCRPGYAHRFVADLIFGNLLKVKELIGDFSEQEIVLHAQLWVEAMGLPRKLLTSLKYKNNNTINFIRSSCCLADKINEELCANCPKLHKKK